MPGQGEQFLEQLGETEHDSINFSGATDCSVESEQTVEIHESNSLLLDSYGTVQQPQGPNLELEIYQPRLNLNLQQPTHHVNMREQLQIGWMEFQDNNQHDPVFESSHLQDHGLNIKYKRSAANIRLWARYFAPVNKKDGIIKIPEEWTDFFTLLLLSPTHFEWTKAFLQSKALDFIQPTILQGRLISYAIPPHCPDASKCLCETLPSHMDRCLDDKECIKIADNTCSPAKKISPDLRTSSSTTRVYSRKKSKMLSIVETDVRRSDRIEEMNKGFRGKTCSAQLKLQQSLNQSSEIWVQPSAKLILRI